MNKVTERSPQLLSVRETLLLERFRSCCPDHQDVIEHLAAILTKRCTAEHNSSVIPFVNTRS